MDRQHRHDLKHDRFVDELGALSARARDNQKILLTIGGAAVLIALVIYGVIFYRGNREDKAQADLAVAIETIESPAGAANPAAAPGTPAPKYKTTDERDAVAEKQFKDLQAKYSGTDASDVAGLYLARLSAARGDSATARKQLESFIDNQKGNVLAGSARYSLYQLRIQNGEAAQVATELTAELAKSEPVLPGDTILALLAESYEKQGNTAKAKETWRRIPTEFPESAFVSDAQRRAGA
jgi:TolA-binding protein